MTKLGVVLAMSLMVGCSADSTPEGGGGGGGGGGDPAAGDSCATAREQLLEPIASPSTAEVKTLSESAGEKTIYVDASAGGAQEQAKNARVYLSLATGTKVDVDDAAAAKAETWDLAIKRPVLFTNSGHGGPGKGGAILVAKDFAAVSAADADGKTLGVEQFFDADCNAQVDQTGAVKTSFDGWYDYDTSNNTLAPKAGTWIVRGAGGALFKVAITSYYATPEGGTGMAGGRYVLKIKAL
ncbi:MAG: hypothetical protein KF819_00030 [Labilithrix sp.]|nr:hypothetical protein [Labilithrix sp.]